MIVKKDWDLLKIHSGNGFLKYNSYANFQIKSHKVSPQEQLKW